MDRYSNEAFQKEMVILYPRLNRALTAYLSGSQLDADDILQDTLLKACRNLDRFNGDSGLYTWLYSIARNICIDEFRKQKRRNGRSPVPVEEFKLAAEPSADESENEEIMLLRKAIAGLPDKLREVVVMKAIDGMSYPEIAHITGTNEQTLKSQMFRARKLLAASLKKLGVDK